MRTRKAMSHSFCNYWVGAGCGGDTAYTHFRPLLTPIGRRVSEQMLECPENTELM